MVEGCEPASRLRTRIEGVQQKMSRSSGERWYIGAQSPWFAARRPCSLARARLSVWACIAARSRWRRWPSFAVSIALICGSAIDSRWKLSSCDVARSSHEQDLHDSLAADFMSWFVLRACVPACHIPINTDSQRSIPARCAQAPSLIGQEHCERKLLARLVACKLFVWV